MVDYTGLDPDRWLASLRSDDLPIYARLKVFLGMGAGPAGTYTMLRTATPVREFFLAAISTALVTGAALLLAPFTGYQAIALLYLLLVVAVGLKLTRGPVLAVAAGSALLWNLLFVPARFTFYIEKFHDAMMFAMFFVVALAMGHLTSRLRRSEMAERHRERRTAALYELAHQAAFATDLDSGLKAAVSLIESIFGANAALLLRLPDHTLSNQTHPASSFTLSEKEKSVAAWRALSAASRREIF